LPAFPGIKEFYDQKAKDFPNLEVTFTNGAPPRLMMMDENGVVKEEYGANSWKIESVVEFLEEKLEKV